MRYGTCDDTDGDDENDGSGSFSTIRGSNLANEVDGRGRDELKVGGCKVELALYRPRHRPILVA